MRLYAFDFDRTFVWSAMPTEENKALWESVKGTPYPHQGWWSKKESLDTSVFDIKPIQATVDVYLQAKAAGDHLVLVTSRLYKLKNEIFSILRDIGVDHFDHAIFAPHMGLDKGQVLEGYCQVLSESGDHPHDILVFDDNFDDLASYGRLRERLMETNNVHVHRVNDAGEIKLV